LAVKAGHLAGQVPIRGGSMPGCSGVGVTSGAAALVVVCACCAWVVGFVPGLSSLLPPLVRTKKVPPPASSTTRTTPSAIQRPVRFGRGGEGSIRRTGEEKGSAAYGWVIGSEIGWLFSGTTEIGWGGPLVG